MVVVVVVVVRLLAHPPTPATYAKNVTMVLVLVELLLLLLLVAVRFLLQQQQVVIGSVVRIVVELGMARVYNFLKRRQKLLLNLPRMDGRGRVLSVSNVNVVMMLVMMINYCYAICVIAAFILFALIHRCKEHPLAVGAAMIVSYVSHVARWWQVRENRRVGVMTIRCVRLVIGCTRRAASVLFVNLSIVLLMVLKWCAAITVRCGCIDNAITLAEMTTIEWRSVKMTTFVRCVAKRQPSSGRRRRRSNGGSDESARRRERSGERRRRRRRLLLPPLLLPVNSGRSHRVLVAVVVVAAATVE